MKNKTKEMEKLIYELNNHKLFNSSKDLTKDHLKIFMEHHVYVVWDFMSIVKSLQHHICPHTVPWKPSPYSKFGLTHLINEIVFNEESDIDNFGDYKYEDLIRRFTKEEVGAIVEKIKQKKTVITLPFVREILAKKFDLRGLKTPFWFDPFIMIMYIVLTLS